MQYTAILLLAIVAAVSAKFAERADELFERFKLNFGRSYATPDEEAKRKSIFRDNLVHADKQNELNGSPAFGVTKFSDWTREEFSVLLGRKGKGYHAENSTPQDITVYESEKLTALPAYVNWITSGVVTPMKNQGQCGSCWAFSVASQVESNWAMNGNALWEFSPQQVASCTSNCNGCGGGDTVYGYNYIKSVVGLGSAWFAPYTQSMYNGCSTRFCTVSCSAFNMTALSTYAGLTGPYATLSGYGYATAPCTGSCTTQNTTALAAYVAANGPVSICINAANWNSYVGGVMSSAACGSMAYTSLDHCVQLVGYNAQVASPYWIVRNQWATNWGVNGYIYLEYPANTCGIADEATYVTISNNQAMFQM